MVWRDEVERNAWMETWCARCFQPDEVRRRLIGDGQGCPLLTQAATGSLPAPWQRQRQARLGETYRCSWFLDRPASTRRSTNVAITAPLFDVEPAERYFVPVEGWPDPPPGKGTEHQ